MKNNKGFSLVELIIVIAIMGLLTAFVGLGFGVLANQYAKSASKDLYNTLGSAQTVAMSKDDCKVVAWVNGDGIPEFAILNSKNGVIQQSKASDKRVTLSATFEDGTSRNFNAGEGVVITFNRSTGAFDKTFAFTGDYSNPGTGATPLSKCNSLTVSQGSRGIKIVLVPATGKFYFD